MSGGVEALEAVLFRVCAVVIKLDRNAGEWVLDIWQYSSSSSSSSLSKSGISKSLGSSSANLTFFLPNGSGMLIAMSECTILLKRGLTVIFGESNDDVDKFSLC